MNGMESKHHAHFLSLYVLQSVHVHYITLLYGYNIIIVRPL